MGRTDEALRLFTRVIGSKPKFAAAHNEIGKIQMRNGAYDDAMHSFSRAISSDPKTEYTRNLVLAVSRRGVPSEPVK